MVTPSLPGFASWWCEADEGNIESRKARARHRQPESTLSFSLGWLSELRWEAAYKSVGRAATPSQSAGGRHMAGRETGTETDGQKGEDWGKIDGKTRYRACHCLRLCVCARVCAGRLVCVSMAKSAVVKQNLCKTSLFPFQHHEKQTSHLEKTQQRTQGRQDRKKLRSAFSWLAYRKLFTRWLL